MMPASKDEVKTKKSKRTVKKVNKEANLNLKMNWVKMVEQRKAKKKKEEAKLRARKMREKKKNNNNM